MQNSKHVTAQADSNDVFNFTIKNSRIIYLTPRSSTRDLPQTLVVDGLFKVELLTEVLYNLHLQRFGHICGTCISSYL